MPNAHPPVAIGTLTSIQTGSVAPLGPHGVASGFVKRRVDGAVAVFELGLEGDAQADLSVHGGPDKAVYGYGAAGYEIWRAAFPEHAQQLEPGGMGENLTLAGLDETTVCIGDIVAIGSAVLQVSQPRQPCFKFALRFADDRMPQAMIKNGLSGWYYRVLEPGSLTAGDEVRLAERLNPAWPIARFFRMITRRTATPDAFAELADMEGLARQWRVIAAASGRRTGA